ncbi:hypothetical protein EV44_g0573 [Erysiphe necator]|uniref:Secreted effector protein n=1 Tax=Uncinula necator TaxID=52586 RepID=A0A0B1P2M4_UNCNE|nr:hypothetical protein EV44_g0573 [Erysiphe necator]
MRGIISIAFVTFFIFASFGTAHTRSNLGPRSLGRPRSLSRTRSTTNTRSIGRSRAKIRSLSLLRSRARILKRKSAQDDTPDAYRCVLNKYSQGYILTSKDEACKFINSGKKTKGISRWPQFYKPPDPNQFAFKSNNFQLWPLTEDQEVFKGSLFKSDFNNFVVLDANCQLAGVVALFKTPGTGQNKGEVKEYKNCEIMEMKEI